MQGDSLGEEFPMEKILAPAQPPLKELERAARYCDLGDVLDEECYRSNKLVKALDRKAALLLHCMIKEGFPVLLDSRDNCK